MLEINNSFLFQTMLKNAVFLGFSAGMLGVFISYQRRSIEINALSADVRLQIQKMKMVILRPW